MNPMQESNAMLQTGANPYRKAVPQPPSAAPGAVDPIPQMLRILNHKVTLLEKKLDIMLAQYKDLHLKLHLLQLAVAKPPDEPDLYGSGGYVKQD